MLSRRGVATLENLTTGKNFTHGGWAPDCAPLCQQTAEWIVEDYDGVAGNGIALFDFGTLEFTGARMESLALVMARLSTCRLMMERFTLMPLTLATLSKSSSLARLTHNKGM